MKTFIAAAFAACIAGVWSEGVLPTLPTGKCKYPIPHMEGANISQIMNKELYYAYSPIAIIYILSDNIKVTFTKVEGKDNEYLETIKAISKVGLPITIQFKLKDMGNGILKKITKGHERSYYVSIVGVKGDIYMLHTCSDEAVDIHQDFRYEVVPKEVDPNTVEDPNILFKDINEKYKFQGKFNKLPQKLRNDKKNLYKNQ